MFFNRTNRIVELLEEHTEAVKPVIGSMRRPSASLLIYSQRMARFSMMMQ